MSVRRNRHWRKAYLPGAFKLGGQQFNCLECLHPVAAHNHGKCECFVYGYDQNSQRFREECTCTLAFKWFANAN